MPKKATGINPKEIGVSQKMPWDTIKPLSKTLSELIERGRDDPVLFTNELLGMPLHPGEMEYLEETQLHCKAKINILVPSNRWGKSSLAACLQIWYHFYKLGIPTGDRKSWEKADYRTANVAPLSSLIEPVFNYIDAILSSRFPINLPDGRMTTNKCLIEWFYLKEKTVVSPVHKQFFAFNSYIEHRTLGQTAADSLEGKPYALITYDEGGRSAHLEEEVNGTLLARLFDFKGQLHILSTPDQTSPSILYHYRLYQDGLARINNTYTMEGALKDNMFFPKEQIEEQYRLYESNPLRDQVLEGKFVFGGDNTFNSDTIQAAIDSTLDKGERPRDGRTYIIAIDTAISSDEMVFIVLDATDSIARLVRLDAAKGNAMSPRMHMERLRDLVDLYGPTDMILETFNGESARFYEDMPPYMQEMTSCYGTWQPKTNRSTDNRNTLKSRTATVKKADILVEMRKALAEKTIRIPNDQKLVQQLSIYREDDSKLATDRVLCLCMAVWLIQDIRGRDNEVGFEDW